MMKEPPAAVSARHEQIARWLGDEGRLDVVDAAQRLGVAQETVRRDLRTLEAEGRLQRVHGGAITIEANPFPALSLPPPPGDSVERAFGQQVWDLLPRRGTILLGAGRLCSAVALAIGDDPPEGGLTVVTSSLDSAITLARVAGVSVYTIGGTVSPTTRAQEGDWALQELARMHVDVGLVAPAGLSPEHGLSQSTPAAAAVSRAEVACSETLIALADAAVLGTPAFVRFAAIGEVDRLLVCGTAPVAALNRYAEHGVRADVITPDADPGAETLVKELA